MTRPTTYVLDANVFIEAKQRYYAFDVCPGFWDALDRHCGAGAVCSIDRIKDEIVRGKDVLSDWATRKVFSPSFVSSADQDVVDWFGQVQIWANAEIQYNAAAKAEFAGSADAWLIAYAKAKDYILVTHEVFIPDAHRRVPIPNVCQAFGVRYENSFDMLRGLATSFVCAS